MARSRAINFGNGQKTTTEKLGISKSAEDVAMALLVRMHEDPQTEAEYKRIINKAKAGAEDVRRAEVEVLPEQNNTNTKGSRFSRLIDQMEQTDKESNRVDARIYGTTAKLIADAGGEVNIDMTQPQSAPKNRKSSFRRIMNDLEKLDRQDIQNTAQIYDVAARAAQVRQRQINNQAKGLPGSKSNTKKLPGSK